MGLDWTVSLGEVRALTQDKVALQGNLDPSVLFAGEDVVRQEAVRLLKISVMSETEDMSLTLATESTRILILRSLPRLSTKFIPTAVNSIPAKRFKSIFLLADLLKIYGNGTLSKEFSSKSVLGLN